MRLVNLGVDDDIRAIGTVIKLATMGEPRNQPRPVKGRNRALPQGLQPVANRVEGFHPAAVSGRGVHEGFNVPFLSPIPPESLPGRAHSFSTQTFIENDKRQQVPVSSTTPKGCRTSLGR